MRIPFTPLPLVLSILASPAVAQNISGGAELKSSYVLGDFLYQGGPDPVLQAYVNVDIAKTGCQASGWANQSLGRQVGNEIDLGGNCRINVDKKTSVTLTGWRYFLFDKGVPDMTALLASASRGPVDANFGVYIWDKRPNGIAGNVGYTATLEKFTLRGSLHYAHGLGDNSIIFAGAQVSYPLTKNVSLGVKGYLPLARSESDGRKGRVVASLSFNF